LIQPSVNVTLVDQDGLELALPEPRRLYEWYVIPTQEVEVLEARPGSVKLGLIGDRGPGRTGPSGVELPDVPVGSLPIVTLNPNTGNIEIVPLSLPVPEPFDQVGIDEMWRSVVDLPEAVRSGVRRRALWEGVTADREYSDFELSVPSLPKVFELSKSLLHRWPQRESSENYWRPIEIAGGREDAHGTIRRLDRAGAVAIGNRVMPRRSLRRRASTEDWQLPSLAAVVTELVRRIKAEPGLADASGAGTLLLEEVAALSSSRATGSEPLPSSWPWGLRTLYDLALEALAFSTPAGVGPTMAPLCHLWRLYEAWVSTQVINWVAGIRGRSPDIGPGVAAPGNAWKAMWRDDNVVTEVWGQLQVSGNPIELGDDPTLSIRSVTSQLVPDILVVVATPQSATLIAFDAKRTSSLRLLPDEATTTASKYHWGLRATHANADVYLDKVVLVTCASPPTFFDNAKARTISVRARPVAGDRLIDSGLLPAI
jgi:hypothetical protein